MYELNRLDALYTYIDIISHYFKVQLIKNKMTNLTSWWSQNLKNKDDLINIKTKKSIFHIVI